jgi:C-terminal processing protease CtpA/Prc
MKDILIKYKIVFVFIIFIALAFVAGIASGNYLNNKQVFDFSSFNIINNTQASTSEPIDMAPFWQVWKMLDEKYVATGKSATSTPAQDRVWGAIQGMTSALGDPYTVFMPPADAEEFETNISGNFEGGRDGNRNQG